MALVTPRRRASTLKAPASEVRELKSLLDGLKKPLISTDERELVNRLAEGQQIRQSLHDDNSTRHSKDAFRHLDGFQIVLEAMRLLLASDHRENKAFGDLLQTFFDILSAALRDHRGNQRYFQQRVDGGGGSNGTGRGGTGGGREVRGQDAEGKGIREGERGTGGWILLQDFLQAFLTNNKHNAKSFNIASFLERIFGCLLACALSDESLIPLYGNISRRLNSSSKNIKATTDRNSTEIFEQNATQITTILNMELDPNSTIDNPEALLVLVELWKDSRTIEDDTISSSAVSYATFSILRRLVAISTGNLVALHDGGVLGAILPCLIDPKFSKPHDRSQIRALTADFLRLGVSNLDDAHFLYRNSKSSSLIGELLLDSLKSSREPSYAHFDLSLHGYASIELPGIGRDFPPLGSSQGYTLSLWLQIVNFDPTAHTTIFGAFDATQTCFVLVYLEKDTHNLILQTSVTSSRPSVRFKQAAFLEGRWYHLVIVHQRPKAMSSSRASLFINGEFVEQVKAQYPTPAPKMSNKKPETYNPAPSRPLPSSSYSPSSLPNQGNNNAIQAFMGTPQDLATRLGKGLISTQWRLASSHLFSSVLSDDLITVYYQLGPRYTGNFQDCLGSFQTYQASAALNLRNESLHPGTEDNSEIVAAIRSKAGRLLPESTIMLNLSASVVLDDNDQNSIDETQLIKSLSKPASKNLKAVTRAGCNAIAINGAIPSINEALQRTSGYAVLTGTPTIVVPQSLDEASWRIGGCASVSLALLESSKKEDEIERALMIVFESIRDNWRNSEAMEREHGFGVLATISTTKLEQPLEPPTDSPTPTISEQAKSFHLRILNKILGFVGFQADRVENSVINNPLAYRILLIDTSFWRTCSSEVQKLYYEQFLIFVSRSKYRHFNLRRLLRMRILKKWLETLKSETFTEEIFEYFHQALRAILNQSFSADSMRSLSLYITYAIHKLSARDLLQQQPSRNKSLKLKTNSLPIRRKTLSSPSPNSPLNQSSQHSFSASPSTLSTSELTQPQIGLRLLETYVELLCQDSDSVNIQKFARTVTNKWLLHLIADEEGAVVVMAAKILARLLITSGPPYMSKFIEKTGGITIMQHRFKRWWDIPSMWVICLAILFGVDVAKIDFRRSFDLFNLLELFSPGTSVNIAYPELLSVITTMLQNGLRNVTREQLDPDSPITSPKVKEVATFSQSTQPSKTLSMNTYVAGNPKSTQDKLANSALLLRTVTRFLADLHSRSQTFRDFTNTSNYVQEMFAVLFPIVVSSDTVSPETELHARDSALTFHGNDVIMRPLAATSMANAPVVRTSTVDESGNNNHPNGRKQQQRPRRMSSYVLVTSEATKRNTGEEQSSASRLQAILGSSKASKRANFSLSSAIIQELLENTIAVFEDQIFMRKDFPGLGLFMRVPPGFQEHQAYFETFILRNTLSQLGNHIKLNQKLLWEPRVLTNLSKFAAHLSEGIYEGWFIDGAEISLDFLAQILEYVQLPDVATIKSIRLCSNIIANIRIILLRIVLLRLSELDEAASSSAAGFMFSFLNKLAYWQTVLQPTDDAQTELFRLFCYLLYNKLTSESEEISMAAANLWRMLIVQKPDEITDLLMQGGGATADGASLARGFKKIMELDNEAFLGWVSDHDQELDYLLFRTIQKSWDQFVEKENQRTAETAKARIGKRREKLRAWEFDHSKRDEILRRHESSTHHWRSNIYAAENLKRQRAVQDHQDGLMFYNSTWEKMKKALTSPCGVFEEESKINFKWQLDQTEGRNRMRLRLIPDRKAHLNDFQPKRRQSQGPSKMRRTNTGATLRSKASVKSLSHLSTPKKGSNTPSGPNSPSSFTPDHQQTSTRTASPVEETVAADVENGEEEELEEEHDNASGEDDFEIIDSPSEELDGYEDKNRKVMRSLQRGDQVQQVHNVARIVGLEAMESLFILGKSHLYLLDNLFQRSDGEVVNAWQAPQEERDPYLQMISGREADSSSHYHPSSSSSSSTISKTDHETRSWRWEDVLSISKRRFLFRDVAIELFFVDGRSYLLTTKTSPLRDELFQRLFAMATNVTDRSITASEDSWRIDAVRNPADETQTFGSKFTSVFASATSNPATKRWIKGEISNYHYLMLVNTMAGRTFNDLTQYPVFPWVIADYTSEELDLTDPRSYRDLSKPMGCQTAERQAEFRDRYQSFAEMGDQNAPPFHYGTHYSSAMIVTSYLIRLQPFVQSYLLLQGGTFDHPDRLFYSIEKAWSSAARENMTDVRELIPEFFYLPEFLSNINGYDFGTRQGNGGGVDTVLLPPWAKGDPKIFIAKNREALESEYVSQHLHQWIDLIFGHKQRGENALEATNVFHHLSYHGSKNLDAIEDPVERLATIGIIHNFGQTPHQIFHKAHPPRDDMRYKIKTLDSAAPSLTRLPFPVLEVHDRIASLQFSTKHNQLLSAGTFRIHIGPAFEKYMEWGFVDNSVRFFITDSKKLVGLFEHVHQSQLSCALFADSKTLITAGNDCTVSVWTVLSTPKSVDLQPRATLFGHRRSVTTLAVSRSFSALLSASSDGQVLLWDLTRLELVRVLTSGKPVDCAKINDVDGTILLCQGSQVTIWTINGDLMIEQDLFAEGEDTIFCCAFYEGSGNDYLERNLIFTGQRRGVVNIWNIAIRRGCFVLEHLKSMHHLDQAGFNVIASMTAVLPMAHVVYTGDDDGRVYEWDCIQRQ